MAQRGTFPAVLAFMAALGITGSYLHQRSQLGIPQAQARLDAAQEKLSSCTSVAYQLVSLPHASGAQGSMCGDLEAKVKSARTDLYSRERQLTLVPRFSYAAF